MIFAYPKFYVWVFCFFLGLYWMLLIIQALESVEEALKRLEQLLQELHVSSTNSGREHLKAACSDLEKIRKLKKEAEFLEASFRAKAAFLQQVFYCLNDFWHALELNGKRSVFEVMFGGLSCNNTEIDDPC